MRLSSRLRFALDVAPEKTLKMTNLRFSLELSCLRMTRTSSANDKHHDSLEMNYHIHHVSLIRKPWQEVSDREDINALSG